jgi:threonine synthase
MHFVSTRDASHQATLSTAIERGLAPDGGLYIPAAWPSPAPNELADPPAASEPDVTAARLARIAVSLLTPFAASDRLAPMLPEIVQRALNFPAPLVQLSDDGRYNVLELFHGPTGAFKDFGARFLAEALAQMRPSGAPEQTILVATSGDTGGAVAAAFHRRPGFRVVLLFPKGLVSPTQERQLTCWGDNVTSCAVRGTFDDCQRMAKSALGDAALRARYALSSANSINIGRLLPQAAYFAAACLTLQALYREPLSFIVPSGNLGNAFACLIARLAGLPVGRIVLAHNANRTVPDYCAFGTWEPRPSIATIASAMDVGNPSNMERFRALYPTHAGLCRAITAVWVDDETIRARIGADATRYGRVWCPHTATAAEVHARLQREERDRRRWCIVATAHPAKFPEVVEPIVGRKLEVPQNLRDLAARPTSVREIDVTTSAAEFCAR